MEAQEAIYKQVEAYFLADTTTLVGLNAADSTAYVRDLARVGDPLTRATPCWPNVEVDVNPLERSPFPGASETKAVFDSTVTFIIETDRDAGFDAVNRIESRIRTRFHNQTLSNLVDADASGRTWYFSPMVRMTPRRLENTSPRNKTLRLACPYRLVAEKGMT